MKKFTFMLLAAFIAVTAMAGGPQKRLVTGQTIPAKVQLAQKLNLKQASREMLGKVQSSRARAPKKAVAAADLVGDYTWEYQQANESSTDLESLETTVGSAHVTIAESETGLTISGMFSNDLEATIVSDEESGDWIVIAGGQIAGTTSYGDYVINGMFYYEGDDEKEAGWYFSDIHGQILEDGSIYFVDWMCRVLSGGDYDGYSLTPYFVEGSTLTASEPLTVVTVPEGVEILPYVLAADNTSASVNVAVDGNDVYFQGMSNYIPEAWVKGTKDGNTVTFPQMQYMGEYGSYGSSFFFYNGETVFTYDEEAKTYSAEGQVFGVLADRYYDGNYTNPVLKPVVEKAAMPANPEITALQNGDYGWYFNFNVPAEDVDGDGLLTSKLYYMIYTDIEGEITPLTFTPETHTKLTEAMTEIPFGFTEDWDIYDNQIYLNDLYSADWNNLGIQSIYYGGDEINATEIQWFHIKDYSGPSEATFDFNKMDIDVSSNVSHDGDITETLELTAGDVTLAISPKTGSATTENRFWGTSAGPQLRVYSGTLTFSVPEGSVITQIVFNAARWNDGNAFDCGEFDATTYTWTGSTETVVLTIAANTQINSIAVTVDKAPEKAIDPDGITYTFDDGTLQGWTTIDADGDGYDWAITNSSLTPHGDNGYAVYSQSYDKTGGALTPDNYLVSPKIKLGSRLMFYAVAQDASYPEEHFGVAVSTSGKDVADFEMVEEWTLKAVRHNGPRKAQGTWYQYIVDLSKYEGEEGYVAIRHFDCTDMFYILVDDITFGLPAIEVDPEEGVVEQLDQFVLRFNKYQVVTSEETSATLLNETTGTSLTGTVAGGGSELTVSFEATTEPGDYTMTVTGVQTTDGDPVELSFNYTIEEPLVLVELPEGVETLEYTLAASGSDSQSALTISDTKLVAFDGTDVYLQGLAYWFPEAYVKGTLTEEGQVLVPSGQYVGTDDYGDEFLVALDVDEENNPIDAASGVIAFNYDAESGVMSLVEGTYYGESSSMGAEGLYNYFYSAVYSPGALVAVEAPEGLETETYLFSAMQITAGESESTSTPYEFQTQVGFDGQEVYFKGFSNDTEEYWAKGTLSEDGKTVTIPANQYMGRLEYWGYVFDYFVTAVDEEGNFADLVLNYDAETSTFTTEQTMVLNGSKTELNPYQTFTEVVITKMVDFAATPEDPIFESYDFEQSVGYNKIYASIPTKDVDGNNLMTSKLFYTIWFEKDGVEQPYTFTATLYSNDFDEDVTEVPYSHDGYDIYSGGEIIYLEDEVEELQSWTKVGIQSIYYGGGERNTSNIVWVETTGTGIVSLMENSKDAVIYNLAGQRVQKAQKGLFIVNGKKIAVK